MTLVEVKDFISNYTPYILQYISEDTIFFSYNMVDFSIRVLKKTETTETTTLVENSDDSETLVLSKKEFDTSGDYIEGLQTKSLNKLLNSIDLLYLTNKL